MSLGVLPRQFVVDVNGAPRVGAKLYIYAVTTTTPITAYTTAAYAVEHDSPILSVGDGFFPAYYINPEENASYKVLITDADDVPVYTEDNIPAAGSAGDVGASLYPETADEQSAGATVVNFEYPAMDVRRYGDESAGFYSQDALIAAIEVADLAKGAAFIAAGVNVKVTSRLDAATSSQIRILGAVDCRKTQETNETGVGLPTITLDNTALVGDYNSGTDTLIWSEKLRLLKNVRVVGINSAKVAMVVGAFGADIGPGCHLEDFVQHGIISSSSTLTNFGPFSSYNVGEGRDASGLLTDEDFVDGCALLMVGANTSGVTGNMATARTNNPGSYGGACKVDVTPYMATVTNTSFKGVVAYNQRSIDFVVKGFGGVYLSRCLGCSLTSAHLEVYAAGGEADSDDNPLALVTLNSAVHVEGGFFSVSLGDSIDHPILHLRTDTFSSAFDFQGYFYDFDTKKVMSRGHIAELVFGDYAPNADDTALTPVYDLGTAANPMAYYNATLKALLVSQGSHFYPLLAFPQFQSGSLLTANNVTTTDPPYSQWNIGGGSSHADGGVEYEVSLMVASSAGVLYHISVWRLYQMQGAAHIMLLNEENPTAGIAVTESSSRLLNIANTSGVTLNWRAMYRLLGPAVGAPVN